MTSTSDYLRGDDTSPPSNEEKVRHDTCERLTIHDVLYFKSIRRSAMHLVSTELAFEAILSADRAILSMEQNLGRILRRQKPGPKNVQAR